MALILFLLCPATYFFGMLAKRRKHKPDKTDGKEGEKKGNSIKFES